LGGDPRSGVGANGPFKLRELDGMSFMAATPRWAGGRNDLDAGDTQLQLTRLLGPLSYAERDHTQTTGRHYQDLPRAFQYMILFFVGTILGFNPFFGVWIGLALAGVLMNQVERLFGLLILFVIPVVCSGRPDGCFTSFGIQPSLICAKT